MKTGRLVLFFLGVSIASGLTLLRLFIDRPPEEVGIGYLALLFLLIFICTTSIATLSGFFLRRMLWPKVSPYVLFTTSRRQGVWLGLLFMALLILQITSTLNIWTSLTLLVIVLLLELYTQ